MEESNRETIAALGGVEVLVLPSWSFRSRIWPSWLVAA